MIRIGSGRRRAHAGFVDLLLACHERVRSFSLLAQRLAGAPVNRPADIQDAAHRVRRYFGEALPLHARDEEETLLPRLAGQDVALDAALERMSAEHRLHAPLLAELVRVCGLLELCPERLRSQREQLGAITSELVPALATHLEQEELVVFPAIPTLLARDPDVERQMLAELRARRAQYAPHP